MDPIELIAGLGNPGQKYAGTRHNAGFWFVDRIAERGGGDFRAVGRLFGDLSEVTIAGHRVRLLKPTTFVNRSGQSVAATARYYKVAPGRVLVVHDEIDLPAGTIRLKAGGGHGGHNGLRDIIAQLGDNTFARLRLGVGHPGSSEDVVGHVLRRAGPNEQTGIDEAIERGLGELEAMVRGDIQGAMNTLNRREKSSNEGSSPETPANQHSQ